MSSVAQMESAQAPAGSVKMIATLTLVTMLSGLIIVAVVQQTMPRILENRRVALERAVFEVLPGAATKLSFVLEEDAIRPLLEENTHVTTVYAGYDESGRLVGIALQASGQGYQDIIRVLYGYSPDTQEIIGFKVLESKETPGLGDKIAKDPKFLANFTALDVHLNETGDSLTHALEFVKHGTKSNPWEIDGISGATVSSQAVARMLNESASRLLPRIRGHLDAFRSAPQ